ncbi:MAG: DUF3365 domain-containing protein [Planctomycetes bacterium]|jgi:hypothetical protein|nr:DUF3365 domain-containing protein [Planctomycetota bacterium]
MKPAVLSALLLLSCGGPVEWRELPAARLGPSEARRSGEARRAAVLLGERLLERLSEEIAARGLAAAVDVCRTAAPAIAAEVGAELGLKLGRTSERLRNPANRPPDFAAKAIAEAARVGGPPRVFVAGDGRMGVTLPIRLKAMCTACHGAAEAIDPAVRERLAALYPDDRATGYAEGDLRGFFWVELPPED